VERRNYYLEMKMFKEVSDTRVFNGFLSASALDEDGNTIDYSKKG